MPGTGVPPCSRVNVELLTVDGFIVSLKVAETLVLMATLEAPSAGTVELTVGAVASGLTTVTLAEPEMPDSVSVAMTSPVPTISPVTLPFCSTEMLLLLVDQSKPGTSTVSLSALSAVAVACAVPPAGTVGGVTVTSTSVTVEPNTRLIGSPACPESG